MKSILVEDFIARSANAPKSPVQFKDKEGVEHSGWAWAIAKPLNYCKDHLSYKDRMAMAKEVLEGHAIAVHFTVDEIECGEVPTLYRREVELQKEGTNGKETDR